VRIIFCTKDYGRSNDSVGLRRVERLLFLRAEIVFS